MFALFEAFGARTFGTFIKPEKKKWLGLGVLSLAVAIIIIDSTVLNVSQRNLINDLKTDLVGIQWAVTLYSLLFASLVITGGKLGDYFGKKNMFLLGAVLFAIGSVVTTYSQNIGVMILGWSVIEGIGGALMQPATTALLVENFEGKERAIAFGIWGSAAGSAAAIGPLLGGWFTSNANNLQWTKGLFDIFGAVSPESIGWRWAFLINVIIVLFILLVSWFIPKEKRPHIKNRDIDYVGIFLSVTGLMTFVYGVIESSTYGWFTASKAWEFAGFSTRLPGNVSISIVSIIIGLSIITGFLMYEKNVEKKGRVPLISLNMFKIGQFNLGLLLMTVLGITTTGLFFALPLFYQVVKNKSAFESGLAFLPLSLSAFISSPVAGILSNKYPPKYLVMLGFVCYVLGIAYLWNILAVDADTSAMIPGLILIGLSFGLLQAPVSNITLSSVPMQRYGEAAGLTGMVRQIGATLGGAIIGTVFITSYQGAIPNEVSKSSLVSPYKEACSDYLKDTDKLYSGGSKSVCGVEAKIPVSKSTNNTIIDSKKINPFEAIGNEIKAIVSKSVIIGNKDALIYSLFFGLIALSATFGLSATKPRH
jgi:MFS family permease